MVFFLAAVSHIVAIAVAYLLFHKKRDKQAALSRFCCIYSNCAFMAIPLIQSLLGETGRFYASAYITVFNLFSWTQGVIMLTGKTTKKTLERHFFLLLLSALAIRSARVFLSSRYRSLRLSGQPISYLAAVNTPLAMIVRPESRLRKPICFSCFTQLKQTPTRLCWHETADSCLCFSSWDLFSAFDSMVLLCNLIEISCPACSNQCYVCHQNVDWIPPMLLKSSRYQPFCLFLPFL